MTAAPNGGVTAGALYRLPYPSIDAGIHPAMPDLRASGGGRQERLTDVAGIVALNACLRGALRTEPGREGQPA